MLLESGGDLGAKDTVEHSHKTPREWAMDVNHVNIAKMMRFYNLQGFDRSYDALPKLNEEATASASEIQEYCDYVNGLQKFADLNPKAQEIKDMLPDQKWKEDFDLMDTHLTTAQSNAMSWNVKVYPSMYRAYTDLNNYRGNFINRFATLEPKIQFLTQSEQNENWIEEELENKKLEWTLMGYSQSVINVLVERERKKLQTVKDYQSGLRHFLTFLQYVKAQSKVYTEKVEETQALLVDFDNKLKIDYKNFKADKLFINKTQTMSMKDFKQNVKEYKKLQEDKDLVLEDIQDIEEEMEKFVNYSRTIMEVNTGLTFSTFSAQVTSFS